jgi:type II pantothenate kinase
MSEAPAVLHDVVADAALLPAGVAGIDAGLTLTKIARRTARGVELSASETNIELAGTSASDTDACVGVTGARAGGVRVTATAVPVQEIEAAAHGAIALMRVPPPEFVLALLGTGTAFAAVRGASVTHLGGTAMGGGSFAAIARRIEPKLTYRDMIEAAARGDRRNADLMVSDAYPGGIGRIGGDMTAAHLAKNGGSLDDFLAALLNMHGENIAQIAAGRGLVAGIRTIVIAGGFAHENDLLVTSISSMAALFGMTVDVAPHAGFAGDVGAALMASRQVQERA